MSQNSSASLTGTAVNEVAELQKKATELSIVAAGDARGTYYLRKPDGTIETVIPPQPYIDDTLATPQELVSYVNKRAGTSSIAIVTPTALKWREELDGLTKNRAWVPLKPSQPWQAILRMIGTNYGGQTMAHWDLYRLLRVTLRGCLPNGSNLATLVRTMKWTSDGEIKSTLEQAKKTLGASMAHAVSAGMETVPESFVVTVNIYDNFASPKQIVIDLDTLPDQQQFKLTPYPGCVEAAQMQTLDAIRDLFAFGPDDKTLCESYIGA